jgi:hypothetical protein
MSTKLKLAIAQRLRLNPNKKESDSKLVKQAEENLKLNINKPENSLSS